MDLTRNISYNSFTFAPPTSAAGTSPLRGCVINEIDFAKVDARQYLDPRALADGLDAVDVFLGGRLVTIDAAIYGTTIGDVFDQLHDVAQAFNPVIAYNSSTSTRGFIAFDYFRPTARISTWPTSTFPSGIPQRINMRPIEAASYRIGRIRTFGESAKGSSLPVMLRALAVDPRLYLQTQTSISLTTATQSLQHRGTHPSPPSFSFTMSGAGSSATAIDIDGFSVKINLSTVTSGDYTISWGDRHITDSGGNSRDDLFDSSFAQQFRFVQPASASTARGFNLTNMTGMSLFWREAWL